MDEIRVGPAVEICAECGGRDDGYGFNMVHFASCSNGSNAPKGKRAKMQPTEVTMEELQRMTGLERCGTCQRFSCVCPTTSVQVAPD